MSHHEIKELKLANTNNKLHCPGFVVINYAPPQRLKGADYLQLYSINADGKNYLVSIVDVVYLKLIQVCDCYSVPATGMRAGEWGRHWLKNHPDDTDDTELAVYVYQRV